jgi:YHS domain-containing protein
MRHLKLLAALVLGLAFVGCDSGYEQPATPPVQPPQAEPEAPAAIATPDVGDAAAAIVTDAPDDAVAVNTVCPVGGEEVTADGGRVSFNGKVYGFCCEGCKDEFKSDPQKFAALAK